MNGVEEGEGVKMEIDMVVEEEEEREKEVFMWGYLPGALPQRTPIQSPVNIKLPPSIGKWRDVCGGGCGFAMAISGAHSLSHFTPWFCNWSVELK